MKMRSPTEMWPNLVRAAEVANLVGAGIALHYDEHFCFPEDEEANNETIMKSLGLNTPTTDIVLHVDLQRPNFFNAVGRGYKTKMKTNREGYTDLVLGFEGFTGASAALLEHAYQKTALNVVHYERIILISCAIAAIDGCKSVDASHVAEAIQYTIPNKN